MRPFPLFVFSRFLLSLFQREIGKSRNLRKQIREIWENKFEKLRNREIGKSWNREIEKLGNRWDREIEKIEKSRKQNAKTRQRKRENAKTRNEFSILRFCFLYFSISQFLEFSISQFLDFSISRFLNFSISLSRFLDFPENTKRGNVRIRPPYICLCHIIFLFRMYLHDISCWID